MQIMGKTLILVFACAVSQACDSTTSVRQESSAVAVGDNDEKDHAPALSVIQKPPSTLSLDFDSDGRADRVSLVDSSTVPKPVDDQTRLQVIIESYSDAEDISHPQDGGPVSLLVNWGDKPDDAEAKQYVLYDANATSVLATQSAEQLFAIPAQDISKMEGLAEMGEMAKGDVLAIPTEAGIDIFLYWDGGKFAVHQPLELP